MFFGFHALVYSADAERLRAFFRDVLEFPTSTPGTAG